MRTLLLSVAACAILCGADDARADNDPALVASWQVTKFTAAGLVRQAEENAPYKTTLDASGKVEVKKGGQITVTAMAKTDAKAKSIDMTYTSGDRQGKTAAGIYEFKGATLRICFAPVGKPRPTKFESTEANGNTLIEYSKD